MDVEIHLEQDGVRFSIKLITRDTNTHSRVQQLSNDSYSTIKNILRSAGASIKLEILKKTTLKV